MSIENKIESKVPLQAFASASVDGRLIKHFTEKPSSPTLPQPMMFWMGSGRKWSILWKEEKTLFGRLFFRAIFAYCCFGGRKRLENISTTDIGTETEWNQVETSHQQGEWPNIDFFLTPSRRLLNLLLDLSRKQWSQDKTPKTTQKQRAAHVNKFILELKSKGQVMRIFIVQKMFKKI